MAGLFGKTKITDKLVDKVGVQRTPFANPEMYKTEDYSAHLKGDNRTMAQRERDEAEEKEHTEKGGNPAVENVMDFKAT